MSICHMTTHPSLLPSIIVINQQTKHCCIGRKRVALYLPCCTVIFKRESIRIWNFNKRHDTHFGDTIWISIGIGHCPAVTGRQLIGVNHIQQCIFGFFNLVIAINLNFIGCSLVKKRSHQSKCQAKYSRSFKKWVEFLNHYV